MNVLEFTVPVRTVSGMNQREHFHARGRRNSVHRKMVALSVLALCRGRAWPSKPTMRGRRMLETMQLPVELPAVVTMTRIAPSELDDDNLAASNKAIRDQLADHLGVNDRDTRVRWYSEQRKGKPGEYAVHVRIAWLEE